MACSVPHTHDKIKAVVDKQIEEDKAHQLVIMNLAFEYDNACGVKDNLRATLILANVLVFSPKPSMHYVNEVYLILPNQNDTTHERPSRKIRLYTRFFDYDNFILPLSTFLVDVLRHFRINISKLFMIGAAKVSHFEISCRVYGIMPTVGLFRCFYINCKKSEWMSFSKRSDNALVCYTKPLDFFKNWNNHLFWVDDFACPASFSWQTAKHVTRDPDPVANDFNAQAYATLVAHPSLFRKFPEAFLCLVRLSLHYTLDEETYHWFLHKNREEMDIFAFIHTSDPTNVRVVERERNEDEPQLLDTTVGRTIPLLPVAFDRADSELEASVEKLFDEGGSGNQMEQGDSTRGGPDANIQPVFEAVNTVVEDADPMQSKRKRKRKYMVVDAGGRLLAGVVLNVKVGVVTIPTLPFVITYVSTMPEHSSHHSGTNVTEAEVDSLTRSFVLIMNTVTITTSTVNPTLVTKEKFVKPSPFGVGSSSAGGTDPITGVFSDLTGSDFLVGAIRTVINPDTGLQKVHFFASVRGMEHDQLFTEFNVGAARQMSLSVEGELLKAREEEIESLKARMLLREAEAAKAICLRAEASNFKTVKKPETSVMNKERELTDLNALITSVKSQNNSLADREKVTVYENCMEQLEKFQVDRMKIVEDKFDKLYTDFVEMAIHLEEKLYPHLLTTISGRRWLLTHGMKLAVANCLNSPEYLSALGAAIDVAAYNPSAKVDYISALQQLQNVNFSLLAILKSSKDDSVETAMNILRLEGPISEKLGLNELQPNADQLVVPIHHSPDQVVVGATALSALRDVFVALAEPFSTAVLTGTEGTSDTAVVTVDTTMVISITFASTSTISPIFIDDYEVMGADDQAVADENAASFSSVDDVESNIP
nr:hypothetical protein [Tanacetum cinerariifolium]